MRQILFVDDDPALLEGLRDAVRSHRREWTARFADSGEQALAALEEQPADVVVSDLRMPEMDGAELLSRIAGRAPTTARIVLSGQADTVTVVRASAVAHRLLAKPCPTDELMRVAARTCTLCEKAAAVEMRRSAVGASALPPAPGVFLELVAILEDPEAGVVDAAEVVARDPALSAKLLQLANSGYVGSRSGVVDVRRATALVGLTALRGLALASGAAQAFPGNEVPGCSVEAVQHRSSRVARVASLVLGRDPDADDAFAAGLLLDVGLLVMAAQEPDDLRALVTEATERGMTIAAVERERGGADHAAVGAHLLALWGVPPSIVDAVAHHVDPERIPAPVLDVAAATHLADAIVDDLFPDPLLGDGGLDRLDADLVAALGVGDRLAGWRAAAAAL